MELTKNVIPKIMSFIWEGEKMSWMRYLSIYSFRKFNPDWKINLYFSDNPKIKHKTWREHASQDFFNYKGKDYSSYLKNLNINFLPLKCIKKVTLKWDNLTAVHKSDILRWEILSTIGGFYCDTDILYIKSLSDYYNSACQYDICTCFYDKYFSIGFLAATTGNAMYRDMYEMSIKNVDPREYESAGIPLMHKMITGKPQPDPDILQKIKLKYNYRVFHSHRNLIYPFDKEEIFEKYITLVSDDCVGIHWFAGYPFSQKFNNTIVENGANNGRNTFCYFLNKVLGRSQD